MNKLIAPLLGVAAFALAAACTAPAPPARSDDDSRSEQREESATEPSSDDKDDDKDEPSADPRPDAPRPANTSKPASADAGAGAATKADASKGEGASDACKTACDALAKCSDHSFCEQYCPEAPEVITCLAARPACGKADFIACEGADSEGAEPGGKAGGK